MPSKKLLVISPSCYFATLMKTQCFESNYRCNYMSNNITLSGYLTKLHLFFAILAFFSFSFYMQLNRSRLLSTL